MKIASQRLILIALCAALWGPRAVAAKSLAELQSMRLAGDGNRAELSLTRPVHYHYFTLSHPERVVLDLSDTAPFHGHGKQWQAGDVSSVRFGVHDGYDLRVVFDLRKPASGTNVSEIRAGGRERLMVQFPPGHAKASNSGSPTSSSPTQVHYQAVPRSGPMVVEIDPGHGGSDPGTTGPHGLHEKTVTLSIGRMVYRMLNGTPDVHAYLTRHGDYYVSLHRRVLEAQDHHADIYVSIHENAFPDDPQVRGGTCYALSRHGATDAEAAQLAQEENAADPQIAGVDFSHHSRMLNQVLTDLYQTSSIMAGDQLADDIISQFARVEPVYHRTVQHANFEVLRDPMIPSVLCETAFLSNPTQARELHHRAFRHKLARAIYLGIMQYLHKHMPMEAKDGGARRYVVKPGDTLSGIAEHFQIPMRRLRTFNDLKHTEIQAGQTLHIPAAGNS